MKVTNNTSQTFTDMSKLPAKAVKRAYDYFVAVTPKRSGNARRQTKLDKTTIDANYPYASKLDDGYSPKAPQGMTEPTIKKLAGFVQEEIKKIK